METDYVATPLETVEGLLESGNRLGRAVPLRATFLQQGSQRRPKPGPLATLVHNGDRRGIDLYLLLKAVASAPPFNSHRGAAVWARALRHTGVTANEQTISKIWSRLEDHKLVKRAKHGRLADVTLLREDGSGRHYTHPGEKEERDKIEDRYLQLPVDYWLDPEGQWCSTLSLPAKAMLLIGLSLSPGFVLPTEKVQPWYGLSGDTAQRGLAELAKRGVLDRDMKPKKAPLSPKGFSYDFHHTLLAPFVVDRDAPRGGGRSDDD